MAKPIKTRSILAALTALGLAATAARAGSLPMPNEKTILTISGDISEKNVGDTAVFDRAMLEKLGMVKVVTTTPWYQGPMTFEGVPMDKLMADVGAKGQRLVAYALNDYTTEIPMEDFSKHHAILALKRNGEYMPVRDKGPLFIIYPYDSEPELKSQIFYSRSAWQVARLVVK
ncbi:MAG: molybdopterin-dependent oxidoreductase [Janthinobacterium lividum]